MQLYSVRLFNKRMTSTFDDDGNLVASTVDYREQVIHDLPLSTAQMYLAAEVGSDRPAEMFASTFSGEIGRSEPVKRDVRRISGSSMSKSKPKHERRLSAAETGDLAAALNEGE